MTRDAFGPNLRRIRKMRGISLDSIAAETRVDVELWEALERNDFSRWPHGIFARAYIREYARLVGVDPDATVDEFCRWFAQGDRRAEPLIRGQARIVGHPLVWTEAPPETVGERRGGSGETHAPAPGVLALAGQWAGRIVRALRGLRPEGPTRAQPRRSR